jgi:hypothetical protein
MAIKLTKRGLLALSLSATFLAFSAVTADILMLVLSSAIATALLADVLYTSRAVARARCACVDCGGTLRLWVWEEKDITVRLRCGRFVGVARSPSWVKVLGVSLASDEVSISIRTSFKFYGRYRLWLEILRGGYLGLCRKVERVDSGLELVVYPETLYWVLRALAVLGLRGGVPAEPSESHTPLLADAGDYVGSREYFPGSSLRRVDWRSTAKFGRLYVKEFSMGGGLSETLLLDVRCLGRYTCDRIASAVLSAAMARYGADSVTVCHIGGGGCRTFSGGGGLVLYALDLVLKLGVVDYEQLYEFVKPATVATLRKLLGAPESVGSGVERGVLARSDVVYIVSTLLHDARAVLDIAGEAMARGAKCVVLTAPRPWLDAGSLSEAYAIYRSFSNVVSALKSAGAEVVAVDRAGGLQR